jgi:hypothetical protein
LNSAESSADERRIKVLYVAGWQRSGSTILANLLGQIQGFFSTGELYYMWGYVWFEDNRCGCGVPVKQCPVWMRVFDKAFGGADAIDAHEMRRLGWSGAKTKHMPLLMIPLTRRRLVGRLPKYLHNLEQLYGAIQEVTSSRVIVDSSKWPSYGHLLSTIPSIDLYVLHLVRDPRAVAHSWGKRTLLPDRGRVTYMHRSTIDSSFRWLEWNLTAEVLLRRPPERYLMVRYEDLVEEPQAIVHQILQLVGEEATELPFVTDHEIELSVSHTVSGNPNRFTTGLVQLRSDQQWRRRMKRRERALVVTLTLPLLLRYGYGWQGVRFASGVEHVPPQGC